MDSSYWDDSIEAFKRLGSPLRPHASEAAVVREWIAERIGGIARSRSPMEVLVLGVTVELVTMSWPESARLTAIDGSEAMIRTFWPGDVPGQRHLVRGDWDQLPFRPESFDFVVCDGAFNTRRYPEGYLELGTRIRSLLKPGACLLVRGFTQLDVKEDPDALAAAFRTGALTDYHGARFRFHTSLQESASGGIPGGKDFIDEQLVERGVSLEKQYRLTGYEPPPRRQTRDAAPPRLRISYPTLPEFERVLAPHFRELGRRHGTHPLAARCPIFALQRLD